MILGMRIPLHSHICLWKVKFLHIPIFLSYSGKEFQCSPTPLPWVLLQGGSGCRHSSVAATLQQSTDLMRLTFHFLNTMLTNSELHPHPQMKEHHH